MKRMLTPEILDSLPPEDARAKHSRRDLRIFNAVLGGARWLQRTVPACVNQNERVLEIGAGTGELGISLRRRGFKVDALDVAPRPSAWPRDANWHQADVLGFAGWQDYQAVIGNLIFHHFDSGALQTIGGKMSAHVRAIIACEPARRRIFQKLFVVLCKLIGANDVSRRDGHVSIEAGFLGDELPRLLGLDDARWRWKTTTTLRGMYRMVALRRA